jgi:hypothetical protein
MASKVQKQAPVVAPVVTASVVATIVPPEWQQWGAADAESVNGMFARIPLYATALCGKDYATVDAFATAYKLGASAAGYARPDDLLSRCVYIPLKTAYDWVKPKSPTSSAQRVVSAEVQAKQDAAKAETEALAKMTPKEIKAEIDAGKASPERLAKLYPALISAQKKETRDASNKVKEANAKLLKACKELLGTMDKAELQTAHKALATIIGKRKTI